VTSRLISQFKKSGQQVRAQVVEVTRHALEPTLS
jgi:hypothetical protein